jgi:MoxR-like ATPase
MATVTGLLITRCPPEIQDTLLPILSDRVLYIPELEGEEGTLFAREGFNLIATANTRDRGTNEMSAALKRRFNFETVFPIADMATEMRLVREETERLLARSGVGRMVGEDVLELLVTTFRELRLGETAEGFACDRLSSAMSTAEAVSVAHAVGLRAWYLTQAAATADDVAACLGGTVIKDSAEDLQRMRRYLEQCVARRGSPHWQAFYQARGHLG